MIVIATVKNEMVPGQRRAKGKMIRKFIGIGVYKFSLGIVEGSDPDKPVGTTFPHNLVGVARNITERGLDIEHARRQMIEFFTEFTGESVGDLSWAEMDEMFPVTKRKKGSSGELVLYEELIEKGWRDKGGEE